MTPPLRTWFITLLGMLLLAACAAPTPAAVITATAGGLETSGPSATPEVTGTPTAPPAQLLWIHAPGSQEEVTASLQDLAQESGLELMEQEGLPAELAEAAVLVIADNPPAEAFTGLAASSPQTQFLAMGSFTGQAQGNLSVLKAERSHVAFVAGYITQMVSPDFRGGALFSADSTDLADAFTNGGRYLCGRCTPIYAPVVLFPVVEVVQDAGRPESWSAAFTALNQNRLETVFLPAEVASQSWPDFFAALQAARVKLLGEAKPDGLPAEGWVATVQLDFSNSLNGLVPDLLSGNGGQMVNAAVVLRDINPELLSSGKVASAQIAMDDLASGYLHPLSVPLE